ncbi:transposase domain-containing protein [Roseovarius mucosus]|uniref:transposase domain-containing protein n=1 Tax=Roseovarius mucosus TaxID=215743 RepID=UPI003F6EE5F2
MLVAVKQLCGVGDIPTCRKNAGAWMSGRNIKIVTLAGKGGPAHYINLSDLPEGERLAYWRRELARLQLEPGIYDDLAHSELMAATAKARSRAERKAAMAAMLIALHSEGVKESDRFALVRERFGEKGTSEASLGRLQRSVKGVDPINYAPTLKDGYKKPPIRAKMSAEAWSFFFTTIYNAGPEFPLKQAWRDTRDVGRQMGWAVPSYPTFYRRWRALDEAVQHTARYGRDEALKRLTIPVRRDKTSLISLAMVSLDGRTQDFWSDFGDGRAVRPVMLVLVDVASNMVLHWELVATENATATVRLIKRACETYGIPDQLYTDNGSAFAGHLVAGGNVHRFRNGGKKSDEVQPLGICYHMGIKLRFALPRNAKAKIAERIFADLSRVIDDRPEFRGCHAGHKPGVSPSPAIVPIPIAKACAIIQREIDRYNREAGRNSQGARGRSYEQVFHDGLEGRVIRKPTARQLYLSGLIYKPVAVDRYGQVHVDNWTYGGPSTQEVLRRFHGTGRKILLGRDPEDYSAPALAFDDGLNLICEGIEPMRAGDYDNADGARTAARHRKAISKRLDEADALQSRMTEASFNKALAALDAPKSVLSNTSGQVVAAHFGAPLRERAAPANDKESSVIPEEFYRNMDTALATKRSLRGKPA